VIDFKWRRVPESETYSFQTTSRMHTKGASEHTNNCPFVQIISAQRPHLLLASESIQLLPEFGIRSSAERLQAN